MNAERHEPTPEPAVRGKEAAKRQASHRRGQGEGEIHHGVNETPAEEFVPHQHPREEGPEDGVDGRGDQRCAEGEAERGEGAVAGDKAPELGGGNLERAQEQPRQRNEHEHAEIKQRIAHGQPESGQRIEFFVGRLQLGFRVRLPQPPYAGKPFFARRGQFAVSGSAQSSTARLAGGRAGAAPLKGMGSSALGNPIKGAAVRKMVFLGLLPAAEQFVHGKQFHGRKLGGVFLGDGFEARAVEIARGDFLAFGSVEILEIGFGDGFGAVAARVPLHHRDRGLGQDADRGHHDFGLVPANLARGENRFVLPGDQDVANLALHERDGGIARAGVLYGDVAEKRLDEIRGLRLVAIRAGERVAVRGEIIPPRAPGGFGIGGDDRHPGLDQVVPIPDMFGVPFADKKHDGRGVRRAVVGQARLPVGRQQMRVLGDRIDIVCQRQRDHVGRQAVDHRPRLLTAAAVRLADLDIHARLRLPLLGECGVEVRYNSRVGS